MQHTPYTSPLFHRKKDRRVERRRMAAKLFQKGYSQAEVARRCGVSKEAARKWYDTWKRQGTKGLVTAKKPGPVPKLTDLKKKRVVQTLLKGPRAFGYHTDLWTLERVAAAIKRVAHVQYHHRHVWRVLLSMGWSCQKPETRARERDEKTIKNWVRYTWSRIQKRGHNSAHVSAF